MMEGFLTLYILMKMNPLLLNIALLTRLSFLLNTNFFNVAYCRRIFSNKFIKSHNRLINGISRSRVVKTLMYSTLIVKTAPEKGIFCDSKISTLNFLSSKNFAIDNPKTRPQQFHNNILMQLDKIVIYFKFNFSLIFVADISPIFFGGTCSIIS